MPGVKVTSVAAEMLIFTPGAAATRPDKAGVGAPAAVAGPLWGVDLGAHDAPRGRASSAGPCRSGGGKDC